MFKLFDYNPRSYPLTSEINKSITRHARDNDNVVANNVRNHDDAYMDV